MSDELILRARPVPAKAVIARYFNLPPSKVRLDAAFVDDLGGACRWQKVTIRSIFGYVFLPG